MADVKQIVADTLRTLMGATAADPYIKAIEKAIDRAEADEASVGPTDTASYYVPNESNGG